MKSFCVYVAEIGGVYKVGRTGGPMARMAQFASATGLEVELLATFPTTAREAVALERYALGLMRWWRKRGEWFHQTDWSRRLAVDWMSEGRIFCPKWLYWIDLDSSPKVPLPDWERRPDQGWRGSP